MKTPYIQPSEDLTIEEKIALNQEWLRKQTEQEKSNT